jgi:hypothetical protein
MDQFMNDSGIIIMLCRGMFWAEEIRLMWHEDGVTLWIITGITVMEDDIGVAVFYKIIN